MAATTELVLSPEAATVVPGPKDAASPRPNPWRTGGRRPGRRFTHWAGRDPREVVPYPQFRPLSYYEQSTLIRLAQQGDVEARNVIWVRNAPLVYKVANGFPIPPELLADALQEGVLGLRRAIEKFEIDRALAFSTYAWLWIKQRMGRFLSDRGCPVRIPTYIAGDFHSYRWERHRCLTHADAAACDDRWRTDAPLRLPRLRALYELSEVRRLHEVAQNDLPAVRRASAIDPDDAATFVAAVREELTPRQFQVLSLRYGLGESEPKTLEEVGVLLGVTRERVRQIQAKTEERLRVRLRRWENWFGDVDETLLPEGPSAASASTVEVHKPRPVGSRRPAASTRPMSASAVAAALLQSLRTYTFRQANLLVHFYGLCGTPRANLDEAARLLEITPHKARLSLRKARKKLVSALRADGRRELAEIAVRIRSDDSFEHGG